MKISGMSETASWRTRNILKMQVKISKLFSVAPIKIVTKKIASYWAFNQREHFVALIFPN